MQAGPFRLTGGVRIQTQETEEREAWEDVEAVREGRVVVCFSRSERKEGEKWDGSSEGTHGVPTVGRPGWMSA